MGAEVQRLLQLIPESEVLMLQKGVGVQVATAVLAYLPPELWGKAKPASSYAGLIPEQSISGSSVRKNRLSRKGPVLLRKKLYLAALVAIRHDPEMKTFYLRLLANHKTKKQALIAVARKLLRGMMGKLKACYKEQGIQQRQGQWQKQKLGRRRDGREGQNRTLTGMQAVAGVGVAS
ncbi:transposase [Oceanithermus sp.]